MAEEYTGKEWTDLLKELSPRQLRNGLKRGYRRTAKKVKRLAEQKLDASGLHVMGNKSDWKKGIRSYVYSRGGGFLLTVKARASRSGNDKGMHVNRAGFRKPILMWAEDGTSQRWTKDSGGRRADRQRRSHSTGAMSAYGFIAKTEPEAIPLVERELTKDIAEGVEKAAKKAGFV